MGLNPDISSFVRLVIAYFVNRSVLVGVNLLMRDGAFDLSDPYSSWAFGNGSFLEMLRLPTN